MRRPIATLALTASLLTPAGAAAQAPTTAPAARVPLTVAGAVAIGTRRVTLDGQRWQVGGRVASFAPGQGVVVTFRRSGHHLATVVAPLLPGPAGSGRFSIPFHLNRPGRVRIEVAHPATPLLGALRGAAVVDVVSPSAGFGSGGLRVRYLQRRLRVLGYAVPVSGRFDDATARAVIAYRKVNGMRRNGSVNHRIFFQLARGRGAFRSKYPGHGRHAEADLSKQVLALINSGGRVYRVYHVSSGKPSTPTVLGSFSVISKESGYNSLGMLDASYFASGGYAVHGYHEVPTFAASHGCIRAPIPDAAYLSHWLTYGTRVDVYQRGRRPGSVKPRRRAGP
ncbi:MAG: L,D-transpeptidase family protein [Actinomycetota bacterium]|nr:L,D-transpeptidase family protein [Actinomycetota bacterium]